MSLFYSLDIITHGDRFITWRVLKPYKTTFLQEIVPIYETNYNRRISWTGQVVLLSQLKLSQTLIHIENSRCSRHYYRW